MLTATIAGLMGCVRDPELGRELRSFCSLVKEAQARFPDDRARWSRYLAERSDAAVRSKSLVELMRALAVAEPEERPQILERAGELGGLDDFECPAILQLYR